MDDDNADWFADGDDEPPPAVKPLKKLGKAEEPPPSSQEEAPADADAAQPGELPLEDEDYLDPDRLLLFKHWVR